MSSENASENLSGEELSEWDLETEKIRREWDVPAVDTRQRSSNDYDHPVGFKERSGDFSLEAEIWIRSEDMVEVNR